MLYLVDILFSFGVLNNVLDILVLLVGLCELLSVDVWLVI